MLAVMCDAVRDQPPSPPLPASPGVSQASPQLASEGALERKGPGHSVAWMQRGLCSSDTAHGKQRRRRPVETQSRKLTDGRMFVRRAVNTVRQCDERSIGG